MIADDDCWQYALKPLASGETIETTSWPNQSFFPLNESARRIKAFFLMCEKAKMPLSPWFGDRINPGMLKEMTDVAA
jgi:hypothetical protein